MHNVKRKKGYNHDLIFASSNISNNMCEKSVLDPIPPHTQHLPIGVSVNPVIVAEPTTFRRRFNLKKADWERFSEDIDSNIDEEVDAILENYERFVEMLRMASRKHIPNYIPGLTDESKSLYEAYNLLLSCHQTAFFHLSTHFLAFSLNF